MSEHVRISVKDCKGCGKTHAVEATQSSVKGTVLWKYKCPETEKRFSVSKARAHVIGAASEPSEPRKRAARTPRAPKPAPAHQVADGGAGDDVINNIDVHVEAPAPAKPARRNNGGGKRDPSGGSVSPYAHGCKTVQAYHLRGKPVMNICDADLLPLVQGLVDGLFERARMQTPISAAMAAADRAGYATIEDCCAETGIDVGKELARMFVQEMIRRRATPIEWLGIMPPELPALQQDGWGHTAGTPESDVSEALGFMWQRLAGGVSGVALGMRFGPAGAVVGGLVGALFPELANAAGDLVYNGANAVDNALGLDIIEDPAASDTIETVNDAPRISGPTPPPPSAASSAAKQLQLISNKQEANGGMQQASAGTPDGKGANVARIGNFGLRLGPVGITANV